ncbi:type II toxin-antitoxin system HicA family toxin [Burkholderia sp. Bp9012]|uniref:type II toxin-antitoxin system HicA family toxin n=1 Tax=Burkholderia sp. Bp9012 TaxID=2184562 RepID=UPI000F597069|nr:type II toxin-antitoxin system HicA family toxin [Burkholderia sp. Bp9012]RQR79208.1 type II toxin-antitoxin system HicA family toxin [Burkholderia sp. Bp9012]
MPNIHDLVRGHRRLRPLIEYALREGWDVQRTAGGHLKFLKPGLPAIYTSSTASDHRAIRNARARLQRVLRDAPDEGEYHG